MLLKTYYPSLASFFCLAKVFPYLGLPTSGPLGPRRSGLLGRGVSAPRGGHVHRGLPTPRADPNPRHRDSVYNGHGSASAAEQLRALPLPR